MAGLATKLRRGAKAPPDSKRKRAFRRALGFFYRRAASFSRFLVRRFVFFFVVRRVVLVSCFVFVVLSFLRFVVRYVVV